MQIFILNGARMETRLQAHEYLARELRLPEYYGKNLDALADCIGEFTKSTTIVMVSPEKVTENLGEYGEALLDVFRELGNGYGFRYIEEQA